MAIKLLGGDWRYIDEVQRVIAFVQEAPQEVRVFCSVRHALVDVVEITKGIGEKGAKPVVDLRRVPFPGDREWNLIS